MTEHALPQPPLEKRLIIIRAAQRRFAHYGLSKVTMDEIAFDVGMGKASLYYYFPTKEHLFRAVVELEQEQFIDRVNAILEKDTRASDKLREYVRLRFELINSLVNLNAVGYLSVTELKPLFHDLFENFAQREQKLLQRIFREGKRTGEFEVSSAEKFAELFLHTLQGLRLCSIREFRDQLSGDGYAQLEMEMRECTAVFLRAIQNKNGSPKTTKDEKR